MNSKTSRPQVLLRGLAMLAVILNVVVASVWAQGVGTASIQGILTDESGAVLPGVNVTVTGAALQVPQIVAVSDSAGSYRIVDLPVGVYRVSYELSGFQRVVREELRLTVGFTARVDVTLKVGEFEQSITVTGQSPVVDVAPAAVATTNFTTELLEAIPRGRLLYDLLPMAGGVNKAGNPDVGDSELASRGDLSTYGMKAEPNLFIEGLNVQHSSQFSSAVYLDGYIFEEVSVKSAGNGVEMPMPGVGMQAVVRTGGNVFHGRYTGAFERPWMQGNNLNAKLRAEGLFQTAPLQDYHEAAGDLGGRIVRDRLWFYGAATEQAIVQGAPNFAAGPGPDGVYLTADDVPGTTHNNLITYAGKLNYQLTRNQRLNWAFLRGAKHLPQSGASRLRPYEATQDLTGVSHVHKGEYQATLRDDLLLDVVGGDAGFTTHYRVYNNVPGNPSRLNISTNLRTGPNELGWTDRPVFRKQARTILSYYPTGSFFAGRHTLKMGTDLTWEDQGTQTALKPSGSYVLVYDGPKPIQIQVFNYPIHPLNRMNTAALFLSDSWKLDRITVDAGLRFDHYHNFAPSQTKEAGPFSVAFRPAGTFPRIDVLTWNRAVPRLGMAWDVRGTGKTVFKATFGAYSNSPGSDFANLYNANSQETSTYRWTDPNGRGDYAPGDVNLDPNGLDFISTLGATTEILAPHLRQPITYEYSAGLQHELMANSAVSVTFIHKSQRDLFPAASTPGQGGASYNILRPYGAYTVAIERQDPGPDGVLGTADDRGVVTIWDYPTSLKGAAFVGNQQTNTSHVDHYDSVDMSFDRRFSRAVNVRSSFWITKNHRWLLPVLPNSPNDDYFPLDETWSWQMNTHGTVSLRQDLHVGLSLQSNAGAPGQRTATFRNIPSQGTVTLRMEPFGSRRTPAQTLANVRVSKDFGRKVAITWNVFNMFNAGSAVTSAYLSGPAFGYTTTVVSSRVMRLGGEFRF